MLVERVDHELPFVRDDDNAAAQQLAERMAEVIDGHLPGVGIVHGHEGYSHETVHKWHGGLLLKAFGLLEPTVLTSRRLMPIAAEPSPMSATSSLHTDSEERPVFDSPRQFLRLHTADANIGADVTLVNSVPDLFYTSTTSNATNRYFEPLLAAGDQIEGNLAEGKVYHFDEDPLCSVIFRTDATHGPITLHRFASKLEPGQPHYRTILSSDLTIYN